ncbi:hypothetical protein R6Q57_003387 [Mikania cordata]
MMLKKDDACSPTSKLLVPSSYFLSTQFPIIDDSPITGKMNHVVVVPYPSRGHINPLLNLCNSLSSRMNQQNRTTVFTVFVTEEWLGFLDPDPTNDIIRFATIPNVLPSERNRGSDMITFLTAVQTKMERPFTEALDRMELPVKFIIADVTMLWPFDVAKMRNIPVAAYSPMSTSMFSVMHHVDLLELHHHLFADVSGLSSHFC